ncbi:uncharacterized protein JN550_010991 [Neoarthrinium moseri]|uniref:uncharacterized protein n=1 Tax=Neoarthrinium moseri TaxID=1658444 RepID=UPI001FDB02B8|nr:uncharacterized protein JN550_010991 [Neoarthrinium moseri]KAI1861312.1 hypothetical protein JN550_010991 [Neoarthrinium moseri]
MAFPIINGTEVMLPPPEGWVVNFTHPYRDEQTREHVMWAFGVEFPIATLFLIQRVYTSAYLLRKFRIDDYLLVIAWGFLLATQVMMLHLWRLGLVGLHGWEQSLDKSIYMTEVITALTLTAITGTVLAKLSLCFFYYRLSPARWYRYGIMFTGFLCIACFGSVWFAVLFACRPVAAAWNLRLYTGTNCIARPPWYMLQAITGGVTDLLLMIQPIPTVIGLQLSAKRKAGLIAWFGIGTITLAAAVMRLISLLSMINSADTPWTMADAMLWLVVESNLIILCGSLPTFRVWLNHVVSKTNRTEKGSAGSSSGKGTKDSFPLRTFGAPRSRQFDTIAEIEYGDQFSPDHYHVGVESRKSEGTGHVSATGSEEAIMQTRTATISYSKDLP